MPEIRKPKAAELKKLGALAKGIINADLAAFPRKARTYYFSGISAEALQNRMKGGGVVLSAWDKGKAVGFLLGTAPEGNVATVIWVLVSPAVRGKGVGTGLFKAACKHYKSLGCHKIKLTAPDKKLKLFYQKLGMKEEGFHPNHWWEMDFWSFGKEL